MIRFLPLFVGSSLGILSSGLISSVRADTVNIGVPNFSFETPASSTDTKQNSGGGNGASLAQATSPNFIQDWTFLQENDSNYGTVNYASDGGYTGGTGSQGAFIASDYGYYEVALLSGNTTNNDGTTAGSSGVVTTVAANALSYTLSVDVAAPASAAIPSDTGWTGYFTLSLIDSTTGTTVAFNNIGYLNINQALTPISTTFTPTSAEVGDGLQIEMSLVNSPLNDVVTLDDVQLTASVTPEPSTWAMMLLGAGGLLFLARRKLNA